MLDLRKPAGCFFLILGNILIVLGLVSREYPPLTTVNVNLWSGLAMDLFGSALLFLAYRKKNKSKA
jgi:uncharacterized membrane protein HdeD (DUF308 family)